MTAYNLTQPAQGRPVGFLVGKRATIRGFIVSDFRYPFPAAMRHMAGWIKSGRLEYREDIVEGIENAPGAFLKLFSGENFGKLLVKMAE